MDDITDIYEYMKKYLSNDELILHFLRGKKESKEDIANNILKMVFLLLMILNLEI